MKIIHRVRLTMSREVEIPDELWRKYQEVECDQPGYDEVHDEVDALVSANGCRVNMEDVEEVEDEWYDEVRILETPEGERK